MEEGKSANRVKPLTLVALALALSQILFLTATPSDLPRISTRAEREIRETEAKIDHIESLTLQQSNATVTILGKLLFFDRNLSVESNEACAFCHMPETGFTGPSSALNQTTVAYPASLRFRFGRRKPQTIAYSTYSPPLHYNSLQNDWIGGAFWDMHAPGIRLDSPIAEQAQEPPTDPVEMGLNDAACMVYRVSLAPYRVLAEKSWGAKAFAINWPRDTDRVCLRPHESGAASLRLNATARERAGRVFDQIAQSIAAYESSAEVNSFSSKYDYVMAGKAKFTADQSVGYGLFRVHCNQCHRDGGPGEEPLFTDFTASNLGVPANRSIPYYDEATPDRFGYVPNPMGRRYVDLGVGGFLIDWVKPPSPEASTATSFRGKFRVPTLRNVDSRPTPDFVKAYMHNGYFKSLKEVVHFYNTRDSLSRCDVNDPREKITCWPAPEYPDTMNRKQLGNLGLSDAEEDQIVSFLKALSDGYKRSWPRDAERP